MVDGLAAVLAGIDDYAVALAEAILLCEIGGDGHQVADQMLVVRLVEGSDVLARNDEQMSGCLRRDVGEGEYAVILVDRFGWNVAGDDFAEDAIHGLTSVHGRFGR